MTAPTGQQGQRLEFLRPEDYRREGGKDEPGSGSVDA
jgi:hypothetical protein